MIAGAVRSPAVRAWTALLSAALLSGCISAGSPGGSERSAERSEPDTDVTAPAPDPAFAREAVNVINGYRAEARRCESGGPVLPAAPRVSWDERLGEAAAGHAADMARHGIMSHQGTDGLGPGDRITNAGYRWEGWAENVAAGQRSVDAVVRGWIDSAGHCANIMNAELVEIGLAVAENPDSRYRHYWVLKLARPRN